MRIKFRNFVNGKFVSGELRTFREGVSLDFKTLKME